jgi:hypothetical protein
MSTDDEQASNLYKYGHRYATEIFKTKSLSGNLQKRVTCSLFPIIYIIDKPNEIKNCIHCSRQHYAKRRMEVKFYN